MTQYLEDAALDVSEFVRNAVMEHPIGDIRYYELCAELFHKAVERGIVDAVYADAEVEPSEYDPTLYF